MRTSLFTSWIYKLIVFLLCLIFSVDKISAQLPKDTLVINSREALSLNKHLYVLGLDQAVSPAFVSLEVPTNDFFKMYPKEVISFGVAKKYYWLVFTIKNATPNDVVSHFKLNYAGVNYAYLYKSSVDGFHLLAKSGIRLPFHLRPYKHFDTVFPLSLQSGEASTYLIMLDKFGESLSISPQLFNSENFNTKENNIYLIYGMVAGIMLLNVIVNVFLYFSLRQKIHLIYAGYVCAICYWIFAANGFDYQYLYPNYPIMPAISEFISTSLGLVMMSYLIIVFLDLKKDNRMLGYIKMVRLTLLVLMPFSLVMYYGDGALIWVKEVYFYLIVAVSFIAVIVYIVAAFQRAFKDSYKPAWFYLASVSYLAYAIIAYCFILLGYTDERAIAYPNNVQIGIMIETIAIFLGIIYRYNLYKKEKEMLSEQIYEQEKETIRQILLAQEDERRRLAQDLHDDLGATLSSLVLYASNTSDYPESDYLVKISKKALSDLRLISHNLLPNAFVDYGLFNVVQNKLEELNQFSNIHFKLKLAGDDKSLSHLFAVTLFRVVNELLNNVVKHSQAANCILELIITDEQVVLILEDDGIGMKLDEEVKGMGIRNVKSRVKYLSGKINIDANKNGTTTILEIPKNSVK
ncbi:7TM diverse intracellular signaling domain-containing protein [Pedobacter sp. ASV28]|uniref:sensor histidine kinase n=1 Tax=Pedobacter sp. ASV28 TaxID=2795123 RepID=UPI0018EB0782|nr:7TM diverse intracellular signaling domain-containing protein [Pedobacter sp. ASV28]